MIELCSEYLPVRWLWLYVLVMSRMHFRVNPLSVDIAPASTNEFLDIQAITECWFTMKCRPNMTMTYSQIHNTDKYSKHSWIIWKVWSNGWMFVYELSGSGFESSCNHLNFRFCTCFEQGVLWHSGNYRVWIISEMHMWHDKNIQSNALYR